MHTLVEGQINYISSINRGEDSDISRRGTVIAFEKIHF